MKTLMSKLSKQIFLLMLFLNSIILFAQGPPYFATQIDCNDCLQYRTGSQVTSCPSTSPLFINSAFYMIGPNFQTKVVRLNFIFMQKNDGTGNYQENNPEDQQTITDIVNRMNYTMSHLNTSICGGQNSDSKIQFEVNRIYIKDTYLWNNDNDPDICPDDDWYLHNKALEIENDPTIPKGINVFFTCSQTVYNQTVINGGCTSYGSSSACSEYPSFNIDHGSSIHYPDTYIKRHWMKNCATVIYNQPWNPVVYEWYISSTSGTLVHEIGHSLNLVHENTCANHNIMNPAGNGEYHDYLTDIQLATMHRSLSLMNVRKFVKCNSSLNPPFEVSSNALIDFDVRLYKKIIVKSGVNLTITCNVLMPDYASIIVEPGGKLIVDGGIITNSCNQHLWGGIEVWGISAANQFPNSNGQYYQGYLFLNNALIENSRAAAYLWHPGMIAETGGIISATNSTFRNNALGVMALWYKNHLPNNPGIETDYRATFTNCTFEITNDYNNSQNFYKHIDIDHVKGIKFLGCDFKLSDGIAGVDPNNSAINARDAGFKVDAICTSNVVPCNSFDPSRFIGFYNGIKATSDLTTVNSFMVNNAEFTDNTTGVYVKKVNNEIVIKSHFYIGNNHAYCAEVQGYGISLENSNGFAIEENKFFKSDNAPLANYIGINVHQAEGTNEIYKNEFTGLSYANNASGKNWMGDPGYNGLSYFCNTNTNNFADFFVETSTNGQDGIAMSQGSPTHVTGNKFSQDGSTWHFYNGVNWLGLYYCNFCPDETPLDMKLNRVTAEGEPIGNPCSSHYGDPSSIAMNATQRSQTEQKYANCLYEFTNVKNLYDILVDGGSTEERKDEISLSQSSDMWTLRAKLLGESPHLSIDVLKEIADKTDVFTESVLFDILSANPDELKKDELIKYLEDKENPLPSYMIDILKQLAAGMTYKTALLQEMAYYNNGKVNAAHDMIRSILNDSIVDYEGLRSWLDNIGDENSGEQIISTFIQEGNYSSALDLINTFPDYYHLRGNDLSEFSNYSSIIQLICALGQSGRHTDELRNDEVANLNVLAESSQSTAGAVAKNILEAINNQTYIHCPSLAGTTSYKNANINLNDLSKVYNISINVKPNPANEWAAFDYTLPDDNTSARITINDSFGRTIETMSISGKEGQKLWDTRSFTAGIYYYTLTVNEFTKTGKIVINK